MNKWFLSIDTPYEERRFYMYAEKDPGNEVSSKIEEIINDIWENADIEEGTTFEDFLYLTEVNYYKLSDDLPILYDERKL